MRNELAFTNWMQRQQSLSESTCRSRLTNCRTIERYEGELDTHYASDRCAELLKRLSYTRDDANAGRRVLHRIPMNGDQYNGTATLRIALQLYVAFRNSSRSLAAAHGGSPTSPGEDTAAISPAPRLRAQRSAERVEWPGWVAPGAEDILTLARVTTPYLRFLHPEIVAAIVEDTERHRAAWSAALAQRGVDPATYLWERGACVFPGIRRYSGSSEIAMHRGRMASDDIPLAGALKTDDNQFPKQFWSFILRGRPFQNIGPAGYELAHLLDHKGDKQALARLNQELTRPDRQQLDAPLYGLFTSAANTIYVPKALIRPTDFAEHLRPLIQRRAQQLYGAVCNLLPPPWAIRGSADPIWSLENFTWAEPVGSLQYLRVFLAFRHEQLERLFG